MKQCSICREYKEASYFFFRDRLRGVRHTQCKVCYTTKRTAYQQEHYRKYGDQYRARAKARKQRVHKELRDKMLAYLSDKYCLVCGINDPRVLDFDHIDRGTKSFSIARGITVGLPWPKILAEIKKCQILCANCHRIRTAQQFQWYKN